MGISYATDNENKQQADFKDEFLQFQNLLIQQGYIIAKELTHDSEFITSSVIAHPDNSQQQSQDSTLEDKKTTETLSLESNSLKKEDNSFQAYFGPIYSKDGKSMQYLVCVDQDIAEGSSDANSCFNPFLDSLGNPFIFDENQIKMIAELKDNYNSGTLTINTINNKVINKKNNWT